MSFDYRSRVTRFHALLEDHGVDVALLSVGPDLPYLTGYEAIASERLTVLVVRPGSDPVLLIPKLEAPRVHVDHVEVKAWGELEDPVAIAVSMAPTPSSVAVGDHLWSVFLMSFQSQWSSTWRSAHELISVLRIRKDDVEVDLLRRAAQATDRVMARIPREVPFRGRTETEVARDLSDLTVEEGHDEAAFTIVASGPNGASPHHHPDRRTIEPGDLVVCDFGGRVAGYHSDSTRTFVAGDASPRQSEVHAAVLAANGAGRDAVASGVPCQDVDQAARSVIEAAGFGEFFIHRTGHGIGLEVHEDPYLVEGNETVLQPGMCFSVEPGVYLPGEFGIRIEDIVVCTESGIESLNESERHLIEVS